ncbi:MAG: branched-chain amino acid ABC transporter substrate-binding protein, partial [Chloroflexi bacterium]|nr:branched-chain amino acid ABC transporter substrate-binding protein [Chloroflexota bacterium]
PTGSYHAHTYDATNILLDAIEAVAIQSNGAMQIGRQALRDAIAATSEFRGASGTITCTTTGECAAANTIGIYLITSSEVSGENWPPSIIWRR